jgi:CRISPR-associated protein Cmx8
MTEQTETKMEPNIEELVFELVKNYVKRKFYSKYELTWSNVKGNPKEEKEYNEKKEKIAKSAFLDVRSRTEKMDFINYFVSSLCSVPQHMKSEDYVSLTKALYEDTERIRTLTLLALSANS